MSAKQHYVVIGLGVTGLSVVRYLKTLSVTISVMDTRSQLPQLDEFKKANPKIDVHLGELNLEILKNADVIVLSPGMSLAHPVIAAALKQGIPVIGDIELFAEANKAPVIAITGTNAKSTVTTLVGEMMLSAGLRTAVGGNLGVPVLDLLMQNPKADVFVLELSSFQLETTFSLAPKVATILNITPDHMDRYDSVEAYRAAKLRVYQNCEVAVCNLDDKLTDTDAKRKIYFTLNTPGENQFGLLRDNQQTFLAHGDEKILATHELPVIGKHYQANALAALAIGFAFGLPLAPMQTVLREFKGLPHRCQFVRELADVKWYNDSKGTNVGATLAAIEGIGSEMSGKLILILGGIGKNADFTSMAPVVAKYARHVVLIGRDGPEIANALGDAVPKSFAKSMEEAVTAASAHAIAGDCVLLSPACASFDMFKHFEHRGDVFTQVVERL